MLNIFVNSLHFVSTAETPSRPMTIIIMTWHFEYFMKINVAPQVRINVESRLFTIKITIQFGMFSYFALDIILGCCSSITKLMNCVFLFAGTISRKYLQLVTMQHASFLHRQRALRGLRATNETTVTRKPFSCSQVCVQPPQMI